MIKKTNKWQIRNRKQFPNFDKKAIKKPIKENL